ncbi:MAG: D-alanyl-D-alanine carboxypeptidase family protein [Bacillota bacterium]|nr:D-alanyl-D-alanine carboxypeptidase family protein [Bacillota bacterium]
MNTIKPLKIVSLFLCICCIFSLFSIAINADSAEPEILAPSAILINADTGEILLSKDANSKRYPASTTKVMTALLAIENCDMNDTITISNNAVMSIAWDSTKLGLYEGEKFKMYDLLCAMLIASGNDAANAVAEKVSGSVDKFIDLMNKRAKELGCKNTNFTNPHGLTDENHYTTAQDLAIIAKKAMEYPTFREMVKTKYYELPTTDKCSEKRAFYTTNNMITNIRGSKYLYSPATGIKTGYTQAALNCLVASAEKDDIPLICVVLNASTVDGVNTAYTDTKNMFNWAFDNYKSKTVLAKGQVADECAVKYAKGVKTIKLIAEKDFKTVMPVNAADENITTKVKVTNKIVAPLMAGEVLGTADVYYGKTLLGSVNLVTDKAYDYSLWNVFTIALFKILGWMAIILLILMTALLVFRQIEYNKRSKRRKNVKRQY